MLTLAGRELVGRPKSKRPTSTALNVRCLPEWLAWVNSYAEFAGLDLATLVELRLREGARRDGYDPPPKRTQPKAGPRPKPKPKAKTKPKKEGGQG